MKNLSSLIRNETRGRTCVHFETFVRIMKETQMSLFSRPLREHPSTSTYLTRVDRMSMNCGIAAIKTKGATLDLFNGSITIFNLQDTQTIFFDFLLRV